MQKELLEAVRGSADGGDRVLLRGAQFRSARGLDQRGRADWVLDAQLRHPAAPVELTQVLTPTRRERRKLGFTDVAASTLSALTISRRRSARVWRGASPPVRAATLNAQRSPWLPSASAPVRRGPGSAAAITSPLSGAGSSPRPTPGARAAPDRRLARDPIFAMAVRSFAAGTSECSRRSTTTPTARRRPKRHPQSRAWDEGHRPSTPAGGRSLEQTPERRVDGEATTIGGIRRGPLSRSCPQRRGGQVCGWSCAERDQVPGAAACFPACVRIIRQPGLGLIINDLSQITRIAVPRTRVDRPCRPRARPAHERSSAQLRTWIAVNRLARLAFWPHKFQE